MVLVLGLVLGVVVEWTAVVLEVFLEVFPEVFLEVFLGWAGMPAVRVRAQASLGVASDKLLSLLGGRSLNLSCRVL
jgi:hypothetical protein